MLPLGETLGFVYHEPPPTCILNKCYRSAPEALTRFVENSIMTRRVLIIIIGTLLITGCYSTKRSIEKSQPYGSQIHWPKDYRPEDADFYIHNQLQINAPAEAVWDLLLRAEDWPNWYEGMSNVKILRSENAKIQPGNQLQFSTMKRDFTGTVREFEPPYRLAWETKNDKLKAYHAWLIIPNEDGCLLITDEVQKGKLAKLQKVFLPNKLRKLHDIWLTGFKETLEN